MSSQLEEINRHIEELAGRLPVGNRDRLLEDAMAVRAIMIGSDTQHHKELSAAYGMATRKQEEIEGLRAQLAEYENVIIPSWKREEDGWREDEANAIEFRRVLAEELDKRDADIARLKALLTELLRLLESCTTAEYGYSAKIKAKAAIDAARAADSASAQETESHDL